MSACLNNPLLLHILRNVQLYSSERKGQIFHNLDFNAHFVHCSFCFSSCLEIHLVATARCIQVCRTEHRLDHHHQQILELHTKNKCNANVYPYPGGFWKIRRRRPPFFLQLRVVVIVEEDDATILKRGPCRVGVAEYWVFAINSASGNVGGFCSRARRANF